MRTAALALLLLGSGVSCSRPAVPSHAAAAASAVGTVSVATVAEAAAAVGKPVRITGVAQDAKLSAAVVSGDLVVYCLDVDSWPADQAGKQVTVEGTLEQSGEFQARPSPEGVISQGTEGKVFLLRKSRVQR